MSSMAASDKRFYPNWGSITNFKQKSEWLFIDFCCWLWATPDSAQVLLLALYLGIIPRKFQETFGSARDSTHISCVQISPPMKLYSCFSSYLEIFVGILFSPYIFFVCYSLCINCTLRMAINLTTTVFKCHNRQKKVNLYPRSLYPQDLWDSFILSVFSYLSTLNTPLTRRGYFQTWIKSPFQNTIALLVPFSHCANEGPYLEWRVVSIPRNSPQGDDYKRGDL